MNMKNNLKVYLIKKNQSNLHAKFKQANINSL